MADPVALTTIAKSALQLFTSLAKDEFLLLWNSGKELKRLEATIETISCFLQDADRMQSNDLSVQNCLSRLRNVMYDADDFFDELAAQILHKRTMSGNAFSKEVRLCFSKSNKLSVLYKTAHEVKSIRESLDRIKGDMIVCGFIRQQPHVAQPLMRVHRNKTQSLVHEEDVIGRDQERTRIVKLLLPEDNGETSDDRSLSVVAIIGFGGLGKTTLAQYVYNDEGVKQGFDECLWACINDLSNPEQVLIEIIASKEGRKPNRGLEMLKEDFRRIIGGKKFLLVIDDVWDVDFTSWNHMEPIFRCGSSGSKVLVTTRSTKVAECLGASKPYCVDLQVLSDESAWSLFVKKSKLQGEASEHPELERLGKKIVLRCGNVPLAIIMIGSLLAHREKEERVWSEFFDKELEKALSNDHDINKVLMVSYNDLPSNLKLCFAYCAIFPKDHVFYKDELVRLWLTQGFIKPCLESEQSLEDVGEKYFFYLVARCFFQEVKQYKRGVDNIEYSSYGEYVHTAKMHDLLHDVAICVAGTESVFLDKVSISKGKRPNLRHISIDSEFGDSFDYLSMVSDPKTTLRSLMVLFHRYGNKVSKSPIGKSVTSCRMLRTLCLPNFEVEYISDSIGELIHLRYLDLSGNEKLKHLPESIYKLHHLMFFLLRGCKLLDKLPPKIEKLASLRQLCIEGCDRLDSLPPGLKGLTSLVNLHRVIVHRQMGGLGYLEELDNLRGFVEIELPEEGWPNAIEDAKKANMLKKHKLNGMVIQWSGNYGPASPAQTMGKDEARDVMEALQPHQNLECLSIRKYGGEMIWGWLCTLKNVKELSLSYCDEVEYLEDEIKGNLCLPSLKTLKLEYMRNLKGWWRQEIVDETQRPSLPKVSEVRIWGCRQLKGQMPCMDGIEYLHSWDVDVELVKQLLAVNPNGSSLSSIHLNDIKGLISLPEGWIGHLTALKSLEIQWCRDIRWVSGRGLAYLTALKRLCFYGDRVEIGDEDEDGKMGNKAGMPWKALHGLEHLEVVVANKQLQEGLQYLTRLEYLYVREWIHIEEDDVELPLKGLQNLRQLEVGFDGKTGHLPKAGIQYLYSLRSLYISDCQELYLGWKTLLSMKLEVLELQSVERVVNVETAMEQQSPLRHLQIWSETEAEWVDDIPWTSLSSLQELGLGGMEGREQLPGLQHLASLTKLKIVNGCDKLDIPWTSLTSLQELWLDDMGGREQLPDGIQHLTSLTALDIYGCKKMTSLPNWIPQLTSLTWLGIRDCSEEMERRCVRERGEDWPLIRHLPFASVTSTREDAPRDEEEEEEERGSKKKGGCGGLTLFKCNPKFY